MKNFYYLFLFLGIFISGQSTFVLLKNGKIRTGTDPLKEVIYTADTNLEVEIKGYQDDYFSVCYKDVCGYVNSLWIEKTPQINSMIEDAKITYIKEEQETNVFEGKTEHLQYQEYEDKPLARMKIENILMMIQNSGIRITKNEITLDKFDITLSYNNENKSIILLDCVIRLRDDYLTIAYYNHKLKEKGKTKVMDGKNQNDLQFIENINDVYTKTIKNEFYSSF